LFFLPLSHGGLMADAEVSSFIACQKFEDRKLPMDTPMCDNFKGWGNFRGEHLGHYFERI
jgi:hypothetical protein